jgi:hypothetical protein
VSILPEVTTPAPLAHPGFRDSERICAFTTQCVEVTRKATRSNRAASALYHGGSPLAWHNGHRFFSITVLPLSLPYEHK